MKQIIFTIILALCFGISVFAQTEKSLCPKIEVVGGGQVKPGEPMAFSANVTGGMSKQNLAYEWKVSQGIISSGQGTASITIDTTGLDDTNITAEVKIKGLYDNCVDSASEAGSVIQGIRCILPIDNFGKLPNDEVKARVDALYIALGNEPNAQAYIKNYGTEQEIAAREKQIRKAIIFLKRDASRIKMISGGENPNGGVWTKIWNVLPGTEINP
jgi:hypothetical protein